MHTKQHFKQIFGFSGAERALEDTNTVSEIQMVFPFFHSVRMFPFSELLWGHCGASPESLWDESSLLEAM